MFWLSHHHAEEYNRTYVLGGVRVCARCLGTYPVLLATLVGLFKLRAPLAWPWDIPVVLGLSLPAVVDWAVGRFRPRSGSNAVRTLTGVLLGLALGRSLFIHVQKPLPPVLVWQAALVAVVAIPVLMASARGSKP
ncbi:DUF2085 domain-containing protein [Melittangium boletus]|uniref:DUF2085 domain-containing protein n=1 Tax=Melittangium boletus TaxID=83453 RepID=UPI003DA36B5B